ncbi:acetoacetate--CoA ligase [Streptomyces sp. NPDC056983]|uniref:acetoacetate--CoA ligase n=1 Tax=Streptomyces sp. NPDC056983 TaxID=3345987 RepID=UPI00362AB958
MKPSFEAADCCGAPADDGPEVLWRPDPERVADTKIEAFRRWLASERLVRTSDYRDLWRFSTESPAEFWNAVSEFLGVIWHERPTDVLSGSEVHGAQWFRGGTLNYAEHALTPGVAGAAKGDDELAVIFHREDGRSGELSFGELRDRVAAAGGALRSLGVGKGDRVAALAPNCPETLIAFLATASLGAIWSSCSPEFGAAAVADRFGQIEPKVVIAVNGYVYGGRSYDVRPTVRELLDRMSAPTTCMMIDYSGGGVSEGTVDWGEALAAHADAELAFEPVDADHPLWVLYSSGTTGLPKGIVHGHGGIVVEHLKSLALMCDLGPGDRFFWFTTTGWMMWNYLVAGLLVGSTVVLFDGNPAHPDLNALWRIAEQRRITYFGTSAPYLHNCLKGGITPGADFDLSHLRAVGSTGAPLSSDGFRWIAEEVSRDVQICPVSGGTDVCAAFVSSAPTLPVRIGEFSCASLGVALSAYDDHGEPVVDEVGELVLTRPMPSMPVSFWNDPDGSRLRESYFAHFPGVWRHGDWITITKRGSAVIHGRSDSTLNRGGVRMGTAEFYRVVEALPEVLDSLVIDTSAIGTDNGELLCFVVLAAGVGLGDVESQLRGELRRVLTPRHVPDRFITVTAVPHTLNGKKCEVPVKKIMAGAPVDQAVSRDSLVNPDALDEFIELIREA